MARDGHGAGRGHRVHAHEPVGGGVFADSVVVVVASGASERGGYDEPASSQRTYHVSDQHHAACTQGQQFLGVFGTGAPHPGVHATGTYPE